MRVLLCDDVPRKCEYAKAVLEGGAPKSVKCVSLSGEELKTELTNLFIGVRNLFRKTTNTVQSIFDRYDVVILDNNLSHLDFSGARLTAESIAGYIRAFSLAPYIVSLNKNPNVDFDLRFLVGDYATRTDLAINTEHLGNQTLWKRKAKPRSDHFSPWYWPELLGVAARRRRQIAFVSRRLQRPVLSSFGFPKAAIEILSRHAAGALSPSASLHNGAIEKITFLDVFKTSVRTLPAAEDRTALIKRRLNGPIARTIAADLDFWFRRDIVGPQDILVDMPHLVPRMPFLLGRNSTRVEGWQKTALTRAAPFGCSPTLFNRYIGGHRFTHSEWSSAPCFWWPSIDTNEKLRSEFFAAQSEWGDFVFCEDLSTFIPRTENEPKEFVAEFDSPWDRRYVRRLQKVQYAPLSRFAS